MPRRDDDGVDLGIDTTPRGPTRVRRPLVSSGRALAWSRAFWGFVGAVAAWALWGLGWGALERALEVNPIRTQAEADAEAAREWPRLRAEAEKARADLEARRAARE